MLINITLGFPYNQTTAAADKYAEVNAWCIEHFGEPPPPAMGIHRVHAKPDGVEFVWAAGQIGPGDEDYNSDITYVDYEFTRKADATLFKLRWFDATS